MTELLYFRLGELKGFTAIDLADKKVGYSIPIRELLQNSLDASREADKGPCQVTVYIDTIDKADIPCVAEYETVLEQAIKTQKEVVQSYTANAKRVVEFIRKELENTRIPVLMFLDNGLGMPPKRMNAILSGNSVHGNEKSGGSYGVGNLSSYSLSSLRYVLYATKYEDDGEIKSLFTGSPILAGHYDGDAQRNNRGRILSHKPEIERDPAFAYVSEFPNFIAEKMAKITTGTMVVVLGLSEEWGQDAQYAMASNFFHAISHGGLSINIHKDGRVESIDNNVNTLIESRKDNKRARDGNILSGKMVHQAWHAVNEQKPEKIPLGNGDKVDVYIESSDEPGSAIVLIRNGMLVARHDSMLSSRIDDLRNSDELEPFTVVIDVDQDDAPRLFSLVKGAEGPYHNKLEKGHLMPEEEQEMRILFANLCDNLMDRLPKAQRDEFGLPLFATEAGGAGIGAGWNPGRPRTAVRLPKADLHPSRERKKRKKRSKRKAPKVVVRNLESRTAVRYDDGDGKFTVHLQVTPSSEVDSNDEVYLSICVGEDNDYNTPARYLDFISVAVDGNAIEIPETEFRGQVKLGRMEARRHKIVAEVKKPVESAHNINGMKVALMPVFGLKRASSKIPKAE